MIAGSISRSQRPIARMCRTLRCTCSTPVISHWTQPQTRSPPWFEAFSVLRVEDCRCGTLGTGTLRTLMYIHAVGCFRALAGGCANRCHSAPPTAVLSRQSCRWPRAGRQRCGSLGVRQTGKPGRLERANRLGGVLSNQPPEVFCFFLLTPRCEQTALLGEREQVAQVDLAGVG